MPVKKSKPQSPPESGVNPVEMAEGLASERAASPSVSRARQFELLRAKINKDLGGGARIRAADEVEQIHHIRRRFGIPDLDIQMAGGPPAGTIIELFGAEAAGKNWSVDQLIYNNQKIYAEDSAIGFMSFGYGYDKARGHQNRVAVPMTGAEIDRLRKIRGSMTKEEEERRTRSVGVFDIVSLGGSKSASETPAEELFQTIIEMYRSGLYQIIVVDEANLAPTKAEMDKEFAKSPTQASLATLFTRFTKKFVAAHGLPLEDGTLNQTNVVFIMEARAKIGGFSPNPDAISQSGGYALKHIKAISLTLRSGTGVYAKNDEERRRKLGKEVHWSIEKAKLGSHEGYKGSFQLLFGDGSPDSGGAQVGGPLLALAEEFGVITRTGSYYSFEGERICNGKDNTCALLQTDQTMYDRVYAACLAAKGLAPVYR